MRGHRVLGAFLLVATYAPLHRLLDPATTGLAGSVSRGAAEATWGAGLWGSLVVALAALLLARVVPWDPAARLARLADGMARVSAGAWAGVCALLAFAAAGASSVVLFRRLPGSVDAMVQLLHARALLAGSLTLPLPGDAAAWMVQNSLRLESGWASVYPPFHTVALAAAEGLGAPWALGPLAAAVTGGVSVLVLAELFPHRPGLTRAAGLLVALSPFLAFLGGSHLSHTTAGAAVAVSAWCLLRAREGAWAWSVAAGAAMGVAVSSRPWTGLVLAAALTLAVWAPPARRLGVTWALARGSGLVAGGLPFALLLLGWNRALFGHPLRLGYAVAYGPAHGLGLHPDPWGNAYGLREAVAYSGVDLLQLGSHLLETPLPALGLLGAGLLLLSRPPRGAGMLLAWALGGVGANVLYWHHGLYLGPRFLFETAPAWVALWGLVLAEVIREESSLPAWARRTFTWGAVLSAAGALLLSVPGRASSYRTPDAVVEASSLPPAGSGPVLVFAHGSWSSRVSARLAVAGMRRDSIETVLRRNGLCSVDRYARWRQRPEGSPPVALSFDALPGPAPGLRLAELSPGNRVWIRPDAPADAACQREAAADRLGTVELEPLLWRAPPVPGAITVVARDMGPIVNARVRSAFPRHEARVLIASPEADGRPLLLEYEEGMERLWRGAAALSGGGG